MANTNVKVMDPKYAAVNGSRGPERRCWIYAMGPIKTAQDAKNSKEPIDHLEGRKRVSGFYLLRMRAKLKHDCRQQKHPTKRQQRFDARALAGW